MVFTLFEPVASSLNARQKNRSRLPALRLDRTGCCTLSTIRPHALAATRPVFDSAPCVKSGFIMILGELLTLMQYKPFGILKEIGFHEIGRGIRQVQSITPRRTQ